ncbi:MBL fold metallo-hydrolase [Nocardia abscessus]|uniref:MBL fold metallo-hydrolase n=1 Tax=Nocardia abscessus TaxID=120957 RepID=UPI0024537AA1|nr:MBL fold metallo-hydrolase [Nocardia abscessus]
MIQTASPVNGIEGVELLEVAERTFAYIQHDGTWWINNSGFIAGDSGVVVVDSSSTERRTRALIDTIEATASAPIRSLVNTHHHGDHTFGNWLFEPATIISHRATREAARAWGAPRSAPYWSDVDWGAFRLSLATLTFESELSLWVDERELEVRHFQRPAHTTNDSVVWLPDVGVLYAGDLVFNGGTPFVVQGSVSGLRETLLDIRRLSPEIIVPGHGIPCGTDILDTTDAYLSMVQQAAADGVAAGLSPLDVARDLDLGEFEDLLDAERIVGNLHRAYAEVPGSAATTVDVTAALTDMVAYNGGRPLSCHA